VPPPVRICALNSHVKGFDTEFGDSRGVTFRGVVPPPARTVKGKTSFQAPIGVGAHGFCRGRKGHLIFGSFVLPGIHMILSLIVFFALERNMSSTPFPNTLPIAGRLDVAVGLLI
jgi:hypothetical protein